MSGGGANWWHHWALPIIDLLHYRTREDRTWWFYRFQIHPEWLFLSQEAGQKRFAIFLSTLLKNLPRGIELCEKRDRSLHQPPYPDPPYLV